MRALWDRLILWWRTLRRQRIPKAAARVRAVWPSVVVPIGWSLLTWSMFKFNARAWAASWGLYFILQSAMAALSVYLEAKARSRRDA